MSVNFEQIAKEAIEATKADQIDISSDDWKTDLKLALNETIWANAPAGMPIGVCETAAVHAWAIIVNAADLMNGGDDS